MSTLPNEMIEEDMTEEEWDNFVKEFQAVEPLNVPAMLDSMFNDICNFGSSL